MISEQELSFVAVALTFAANDGLSDPRLNFLNGSLLVHFDKYGSIFGDEMHTAFCAVTIASMCGIHSVQDLRAAIHSL